MLSVGLPDPDRLFHSLGIETRATVVVAVSGGSDSLAALLLLHRLIDERRLATRLVAVTVDHGLRPESADEARAVAALCAHSGIAHRTMRWTGPRPPSGLAEAARLARYRLLADAAAEAGSDLVITGHTRDDQAETCLMREARGEGRGLSGMDRATLYGRRLWIARPLLSAGRQELRNWLVRQGVEWIDDPSNARLDSERVRARQVLAGDPGRAIALVDRADRLRIERARYGHSAGSLFHHARMVAPGLIHVPRAALQACDVATARYAFRILTAVLGGREHLPNDMPELGAAPGKGDAPIRTTTSRCVVDRRRPGIFVHRELRDLPSPMTARGRIVWDGRFEIDCGNGCVVRPAGKDAAAASGSNTHEAPRGLVVSACAAEPLVVATVEDGRKPSVERIVAPWRLFLPASDIEAYNAAARLIGAPTVSDAPSAGHIGAEA